MEKILIVDGEPQARKTLMNMLDDEYICFAASDGKEAVEIFKKNQPVIVLLDVTLTRMDGITVLKHIKEINPDTPVIIMTGDSKVDVAVEAMKAGAYDFLLKPFNITKLKITLKNALVTSKIEQTSKVIQSEIRANYTFDSIIGFSSAMKSVFGLITKATESDVTVLIQGESGTGKELVAKEIHYNSSRKNKPFIAVNSTAIPETLLENELFGSEKGAFTGAYQQTKGKFEIADGGTIFLDEIGDMNLQMQSKLLRVLQEKEFYRVGGNTPVKVDVRIISATNKDLKKATDESKFRHDLYYRLTVFPINLPALKDRKEDIEPLAEHFIEMYAHKIRKKITQVEPATMHALLNYNWPGNIRELENIIERAIILAKDSVVTIEDLPAELQGNGAAPLLSIAYDGIIPLADAEKVIIMEALKKTSGNIRQASLALGIDRSTLYRKLRGQIPAFRDQQAGLKDNLA